MAEETNGHLGKWMNELTDIEIDCVASIGVAAIIWFCVTPEERESVESIALAEHNWQNQQTFFASYYTAMAQMAPYQGQPGLSHSSLLPTVGLSL